MKILSMILFITVSLASAQPSQSLKDISLEMNKTLPEMYDRVTKLSSTTVENNNFLYHFAVNAGKEEFEAAFPKVQARILSTICSSPRERSILKDHKANIVYRYENAKGQSMGQFMIRPDQCLKK